MALRRTYGRKAAAVSIAGEAAEERSQVDETQAAGGSLTAEALLQQIDSSINRKRTRNEWSDDEDDGECSSAARGLLSSTGLRTAGKTTLLLQDIAYQLDGLPTATVDVQHSSLRALLGLLQTAPARAYALSHGLPGQLSLCLQGLLQRAGAGSAASSRVAETVSDDVCFALVVLLYSLVCTPPTTVQDLFTPPLLHFLLYVLALASKDTLAVDGAFCRKAGLQAGGSVASAAGGGGGAGAKVYGNKGRAGVGEASLRDVAIALLASVREGEKAAASSGAPAPSFTALPLPCPLHGSATTFDLALYLLYRATAVQQALEEHAGSATGAAGTEASDGGDVLAGLADVESRQGALMRYLEQAREGLRLALGGQGLSLLALLTVDACRVVRDLCCEPPWPPAAASLLTSLLQQGEASTAAVVKAGLPPGYGLPLLRLRLLVQCLEDSCFLSPENAASIAALTVPASLLTRTGLVQGVVLGHSAGMGPRVTLVAALLATVRACTVLIHTTQHLALDSSCVPASASLDHPVQEVQLGCLRVLLNITNHYSHGCASAASASVRGCAQDNTEVLQPYTAGLVADVSSSMGASSRHGGSMGNNSPSLPHSPGSRTGAQLTARGAHYHPSSSKGSRYHALGVHDPVGSMWGVAVVVEVVASHAFRASRVSSAAGGVKGRRGSLPASRAAGQITAAGAGGNGASPTHTNHAAFDALVHSLGLLANLCEYSLPVRRALGSVTVDMRQAGVVDRYIACVQGHGSSGGFGSHSDSGDVALALLCCVFADRYERVCHGGGGGAAGTGGGPRGAEGQGGGTEDAAHDIDTTAVNADDVVVGAYCALVLACCCAQPGLPRLQIIRIVTGILANTIPASSSSGAPAGTGTTHSSTSSSAAACAAILYMLRAFVALQSAHGLLSEDALCHVESCAEVCEVLAREGSGAHIDPRQAQQAARLLLADGKDSSEAISSPQALRKPVADDPSEHVAAAQPTVSPSRPRASSPVPARVNQPPPARVAIRQSLSMSSDSSSGAVAQRGQAGSQASLGTPSHPAGAPAASASPARAGQGVFTALYGRSSPGHAMPGAGKVTPADLARALSPGGVAPSSASGRSSARSGGSRVYGTGRVRPRADQGSELWLQASLEGDGQQTAVDDGGSQQWEVGPASGGVVALSGQ